MPMIDVENILAQNNNGEPIQVSKTRTSIVAKDLLIMWPTALTIEKITIMQFMHASNAEQVR